MFKNCYSLESIDLSKFSTSNSVYMSSMFENCGGLTSLDLSKFVTSKVTDMSYMFNNCTSLASLKVSFNTEKVKQMEYMFGSCSKLSSLDISTFNTNNCENFTNMFENDNGLELYVNFTACPNLKSEIPDYVKTHDVS